MVLYLFSMATSSGFQAAESRPKGKTAVRKRMASRGNEDNLEVLVAVMAQLSMARNHPHRHVKAPVPTWGKIKSLTDNSQAVLQSCDKPVTAKNTVSNFCRSHVIHTGHTFLWCGEHHLS